MRVGLVLGAGGVVGGAWLVGGLRALERTTGLTARAADLVIGTSSGSLIGALIAVGVPTTALLSADGGGMLGQVVAAEGVPGLSVDLVETITRYRSGWAGALPGSWPLAREELRKPRPRNLMKVMSGLLPAGSIATDGIQALIARWAPEGWPLTPRLWIVACDYATGRRVVLASGSMPSVTLPLAVGASCAMPSYYQPVAVDGRFYVDGAIHSATNLDLLDGAGMDIAIIFSPLSSQAAALTDPLGRIITIRRQVLSRRLRAAAARLRSLGTRTLLIEPTTVDLVARSEGRKTPERVDALAQLADQTVAQQLALPAARELIQAIRFAGAPQR